MSSAQASLQGRESPIRRFAPALLAAMLAAGDARPSPTLESGLAHNLAVTPAGQAWGWGANDLGQLGNATTLNSSVPVRAGTLAGVIAVAAGGSHSVALRSDGTVWAWGDGATLGFVPVPETCEIPNSFANDPLLVPCSKVPRQVPGLTGITAIAAGGGHVVALRSNGTLAAWGSNTFGQLGDGTQTTRSTPVSVSGIGSVVAIAAGQDFTLALRSDGTVWAWGNGTHGELGLGSVAREMCAGDDAYISNTSKSHPCSRVPVQIPGLANIVAISARGRHSLALRSGGTVWAWGSGRYGQMGDGTTANRLSPYAVPGLAGTARIAAGFSFSIAVKSDGSFWGFGLNNFGQLGFPGSVAACSGSICSLSPVRVAQHDGATGVVAGGAHTVTVRPGGAVVAFGWNNAGQLGTGLGPTGLPSLFLVDPHMGFSAGSSGSGGSLGAASSSGAINVNAIDDGLVFAPQPIGTSSAAREVRFTNLQEFPVAIQSIQVTGNFSATNDCPASLPAYFSSCRILVRFTPTGAGERTGSLTVTTNSRDAPSVTLALTGTGSSAALPAQNRSDIWWNPNESGWGLTIADHETQIFAVWYTYDATGKPTWFTIPGGTYSGAGRVFTGDLYATTGPCYRSATFDSTQVRATRVGSASIDFAPTDLPAGWARFSGSIGATSWSKAVTRQSFGDAPPAWGIDYTDIWWNSSEAGWGLTLAQHGSNVFGVLYVYDCDGSPLFVVLPGVTFASSTRFSGTLYTTRSTGSWYGSPTFNPAHIVSVAVGPGSLEFAGLSGILATTINGSSRSQLVWPQPFGNRAPGVP